MFVQTILTLALTALAAAPAACTPEDPSVGVDFQELLVNGNTRFALDLYGQLSQEEGNLFISPYSVSTALAMTWSGARNDTEREMADTLHFPAGQVIVHRTFGELEQGLTDILAKGDVSLTTANSIWPRVGLPLLDSYVARLKERYGVTVTPLDYGRESEAARKTINTWVEQKTREKIRELIPRNGIDPATTMVLVNAIHFKGNWAAQFDERHTEPAGFTLASGEVKQVPTMSRKGTYSCAGDKDVIMVELPYKGKDLSMLILLPNVHSGLGKLEEALVSGRLLPMMDTLRAEEILLRLPKFKFTWGTTDLVTHLQALGMKEAFTGRADFSGMDGTKGSFISLVLHKAFIEVNEQGSEAAAATAVIQKRSMPRMINVNRPFLFLIRDNRSGSILFLGRMADPTAVG